MECLLVSCFSFSNMHIDKKFEPIKGYEGHYEINRNGCIISLKNGKRRELKHVLTRLGYNKVSLCKDGKVKSKFIHRLLMIQFVQTIICQS